MARTAEELTQLSQMYAFVGNSLLKPMNQTEKTGLDPAFWAALPDFENEAVDEALDDLYGFAEDAQDRIARGEDPATDVAVEHTKLFVGPPKPAAAPWETYYPEVPEGVDAPEPTSGFGEPTFQMKDLLRKAGLELSNENHQFEDHLGIELLYASVLLSRAAQAAGAEREEDALGEDEADQAAVSEDDAAILAARGAGTDTAAADEAAASEGAEAQAATGDDERDQLLAQARLFIAAHPARWTTRLAGRVAQAYPDGYIIRLLNLAQALYSVGV